MAGLYRRSMDLLYLACVVISGVALVLISAVIPYGVYTRYIINRAASWPEPMAILLTIVLTFFGAAACYRIGMHMRVGLLVNLMPPSAQRFIAVLCELLMAVLAIFMAVYGTGLVEATWYSSIDAFPDLSVGVTYLPIPLGGVVLFCFVVERLTIGPPPPDAVGDAHGPAGAHDAAAFE
jgi:TRAP-type C4-dicarboxylate transport system permease small subunit